MTTRSMYAEQDEGRDITADWGRAAPDWKAAMNQFAILYADRFTKAAA